MNVGTKQTNLRVWRRGDHEASRHWLMGDEWNASLTLRERYVGTVAKGWWILGGRKRGLTDHAEVELALGGEDNMLQAGVVVPFLARCHVGVRVPRRLTKGWIYERRELTLRLGYVGRWVELMIGSDENMRDGGMDSYYRRKLANGTYDGPWTRAALHPGWRFSFQPRLTDRLLGRMECVTEKGEDQIPVIVPLPEGNYPGTARQETRTWRRKRWPFSQRTRVSFWVEMTVAPPVPGKGENSWDCEDDGIYGTGGATLAEAIANVTRAALRDRERYAGKNWMPDAGWPAVAR